MKRFAILAVIVIMMATAGSEVFGKELLIGVSNFEPFFIEENESGIFIDIIRETFKNMPQYTVRFSFVTNRRLLEDINAGTLDAAVNMLKSYDLKQVYLSDPVFRYKDAVISFKKRNFTVKAIADLKDKSIATHQGSTEYLGPEFKAMAQAHPNYKELRKNIQICELVANGTMDVGIEDPYVFFFDLNRLYQGKIPAADFAIHPIFPEDWTLMGFKDEKIRDQFNQALAKIKTDGIYEAVFEKYKKQFHLEWYK